MMCREGKLGKRTVTDDDKFMGSEAFKAHRQFSDSMITRGRRLESAAQAAGYSGSALASERG